ncbi:MAG: hypothetical protein KDJ19_00785 [Hyphomicrobiaceae bacterium]|nr:hypothetical protein [Hyphomicrobiaceae bacterium]MCC0024644.1 hypothetical protein [Hyphomicrobiaceae bacterium]
MTDPQAEQSALEKLKHIDDLLGNGDIVVFDRKEAEALRDWAALVIAVKTLRPWGRPLFFGLLIIGLFIIDRAGALKFIADQVHKWIN